MKKYILRFNVVNKETFLNIKSGEKTVETRAASERYENIKAGDVLVLVCGKERFEKKVKKATIFKTIRALLKKYPIKRIEPKLSTEQELRDTYYTYPNYKEKIQKHGLIALELKN